jgi:hypothetical protein
MTKKIRKTRSDKGKTRKPYRKSSTHIRVDVDKKPFLIELAKKPIEFIKQIINSDENKTKEITKKTHRAF